MLTAVELSAYTALGAVALLAANLLLGLLLAAGYNPARHWPYRPIKLFRFHNWTGCGCSILPAGRAMDPTI